MVSVTKLKRPRPTDSSALPCDLPAHKFIVCQDQVGCTGTGAWVANSLRSFLFILEAEYFSDMSTEYEEWEDNEGIK